MKWFSVIYSLFITGCAIGATASLENLIGREYREYIMFGMIMFMLTFIRTFFGDAGDQIKNKES